MIETHEILSIADGGEVLKMEVNWNPDDKKTNKCQQIKFIHHDGKVSYVERDHLIAALFSIAAEDQQAKMVPHAIQEIRNYQTTLGITAQKDLKKGDKINVRVSIPLPLTGEQISILGDKVGGPALAPTSSNLISPYKA